MFEGNVKFIEGFYEKTSFMHYLQIKKKEDPPGYNNKLHTIDRYKNIFMI